MMYHTVCRARSVCRLRGHLNIIISNQRLCSHYQQNPTNRQLHRGHVNGKRATLRHEHCRSQRIFNSPSTPLLSSVDVHGLRTRDLVSRTNTCQTEHPPRKHSNRHQSNINCFLLHSPVFTPRVSSRSILQHTCQCPTRQFIRHSSTEPTTVYEGLLDSQPVHFAESIFQYAHSVTGLPWWATIVATTFTLRLTLTLPLAVFSQNIRAKVENLQPEIISQAKRAFVERFAARARSEKWSEKRAQRAFVGLVRRYSREVYVRENCHPAKGSILLLVQLPMWIFLSMALRNMTGAMAEKMYLNPASIVPDLATGGILWFPSLVAPDPTWILPILVGVLNLTNIEMHALHKGRVTSVQRYVNNALRTLSVVMVPIAAYVPSAMSLYWTVSAFYGLGQNILLKIPSARRALGIQPSQSDTETPFMDMRDEFLVRYLAKDGGKSKKEEKLENINDEGKVKSSKTRS